MGCGTILNTACRRNCCVNRCARSKPCRTLRDHVFVRGLVVRVLVARRVHSIPSGTRCRTLFRVGCECETSCMLACIHQCVGVDMLNIESPFINLISDDRPACVRACVRASVAIVWSER